MVVGGEGALASAVGKIPPGELRALGRGATAVLGSGQVEQVAFSLVPAMVNPKGWWLVVGGEGALASAVGKIPPGELRALGRGATAVLGSGQVEQVAFSLVPAMVNPKGW